MTSPANLAALARPYAAVVICDLLELRRTLVTALPGYRWAFRVRAHEAIAALRDTGAPLLLTLPRDVDGEASSAFAREVWEVAPRLTIAVLSRERGLHVGSGMTMTQFGTAEVLGVDSPRFNESLDALVERTRLANLIATKGVTAAEGTSLPLARAVRWAFGAGAKCSSAPEFAAAFGMSLRTLERRLTSVGLTPEKLLGWRRLIVCHLIKEHTLLSVDRAAREAGFDSGHALYGALKRYTGLSAARIRERGGSEYLLRCLTTILQGASETS